MSRPRLSVPNQNSVDGDSRRSWRNWKFGSLRAMNGAKIAMSTNTTSMTAPMAPRGLRFEKSQAVWSQGLRPPGRNRACMSSELTAMPEPHPFRNT